MKRLFCLILVIALSTGPANATGDVFCEASDGSDAAFGYGFGRVPGMAIISATIHAGGKHWSMIEADGAIPIVVAQGAYDGHRTIIDFADPQVIDIVASIRLISASEGEDFITVGTLRIPGVGVFPLACE